MALYTRGVGVTLFAIWSVIKVFLMVYMNYKGINASLSVSPDSYSYSFSITSIAVFIVFLSGGVGAVLHILVGRKAIELSKGKRCGNFTLFLAGCFVVISVIILAIATFDFNMENLDDYILTYLMGFTEDAMLIEVIVFSLRLKRRMKQPASARPLIKECRPLNK